MSMVSEGECFEAALAQQMGLRGVSRRVGRSGRLQVVEQQVLRRLCLGAQRHHCGVGVGVGGAVGGSVGGSVGGRQLEKPRDALALRSDGGGQPAVVAVPRGRGRIRVRALEYK